jgi:uracil-DNA glycosylase family 4
VSEILRLDQPTIDAVLSGRSDFNRESSRYPFYPLDAPEMPPPGPDFALHAAALCGPDPEAEAMRQYMLRLLYLRALYEPNGTFSLPVPLGGRQVVCRVIPGHPWGGEATGPEVPPEGLPRVMIVGKMPGRDENETGRNFCGPSGQLLAEALARAGVPEEVRSHFYVTNVVRWMNPNPVGDRLPTQWVKDGLPLLHQELRLVKPDYVLCLGSESLKALLGNKAKLSDLSGRAVDLNIPVYDAGQEPRYHTAKLMAVTHPAAVLRNTDLQPAFEAALGDFVGLVRTGGLEVRDEIVVSELRTIAQLRAAVDGCLAKPGLKVIAVDGEWQGEHPSNPGAYLRTVQFSDDGRVGHVVVLTRPGGEWAYDAPRAAVAAELTRLLDRDDVQICGSFFAADLPWLVAFGVDVRHRYEAPVRFEDLRGGDYPGGFDVALACHAQDETGEYKLELMGVRYCRAARWDVELQKWKEEYCREHGLDPGDLEGYGDCPDDVLHPYGAKDAAYTRQLRDVFCRQLTRDRYGLDSWRPFWTSMRAFPAFLEIGMTGVKVDRGRVDELTDLYMDVLAEKVAEFRRLIRWPEFNHRSVFHCRELLFGEAFNGRKVQPGTSPRVRPDGAECLYLTPVMSSDGKPWSRVVRDNEVGLRWPSTDKESLGIFAAQSPLARALRNIRFLDQILKSFLRTPETTKEGELVRDDAGHRVYAGGVASFIRGDGRVHARFYQTKETGRASAAAPNLMAISKRREEDYEKILGARYSKPIRSVIVGDLDADEPTVIVEADYQTAELLMVGVQARDPQMIAHCLDPKYDIHSAIAVRAFRLECEPSKKGLEAIGKKALRTAAKNVVFGKNYKRGAEAILRQCKEEGVEATLQEIEALMVGLDGTYPQVTEYQGVCCDRVMSHGFMTSCFGRHRRVSPTTDPQVLGELQRQFCNFGIQSGVADAMSRALDYLYHHPRKAELGYKIILQIHDAVVLEVPIRSLVTVVDQILPECMTEKVPFRSCDLDGRPYGDSPEYRFSIDTEVFTRWGETLMVDECRARGIPERFGHEPKKAPAPAAAAAPTQAPTMAV